MTEATPPNAAPTEAEIEPAMAASNLRALGQGANAARAGKPRSDNPWPWYRPEHANWNEGWDYVNRTRENSSEPD